MKKKLVNYFLIAALVLIWGIIIYRVLDARNGDDDTPVTSSAPITRKKMVDNIADHQDTMHLLLNYRNPFEVEAKKEPEEIPVSKLVSKTPVVTTTTPLKPNMNWGFITYTGYIRNSQSKKLLAIVSINGKEYMMAEGETDAQVKLIKNLKDSIKIIFDGKQKFIAMNTK